MWREPRSRYWVCITKSPPEHRPLIAKTLANRSAIEHAQRSCRASRLVSKPEGGWRFAPACCAAQSVSRRGPCRTAQRPSPARAARGRHRPAPYCQHPPHLPGSTRGRQSKVGVSCAHEVQPNPALNRNRNGRRQKARHFILGLLPPAAAVRLACTLGRTIEEPRRNRSVEFKPSAGAQRSICRATSQPRIHYPPARPLASP